MEISGLQPNCSEAVIRINLKGQDEENIKKLIEKLELEFSYADSQKQESDWDDDNSKIKKEFDWMDTYVDRRDIFGVDLIEIKGDAPFNNLEELEEVIDRYLPQADREVRDN